MVKRGKSFTLEENKQVCFSFLEISEDPIVGAGQRLQGFWDRVAEHFNQRKSHRPTKSIENKWGTIRKETTKFIGNYEHVIKLNISGITLDEIWEKANDLYVQQNDKGEDFTFPECYWVLKDKPRWAMPKDSLGKEKVKGKGKACKRKSMENDGECKAKEHDSDCQMLANEEGVSSTGVFDRPPGSKISKEAARKQKSQDDAFRVSAQAQKIMAETGRERLRILENQGLLNMFALPIDGLEPELRDFMVEWRLEEMRKVKRKMQLNKEQSQPSPTPSPAPTTPPSHASGALAEETTVTVDIARPSGQKEEYANVVSNENNPD